MLCCKDLQLPSTFEAKLGACPDGKQNVRVGSVLCSNDKHRRTEHHWHHPGQTEMLCNIIEVPIFIEKYISLPYYAVSQLFSFSKTPNFTSISFLQWPQLFIWIFTPTILSILWEVGDENSFETFSLSEETDWREHEAGNIEKEKSLV